MADILNKKYCKLILFWLIFWAIQSIFMSGGEFVKFYLIKNIAIVSLQAFVVFINVTVLFPLFFEQKKHLLYIFLSVVLIYLVFTFSFLFIDLALYFTDVKFQSFGIQFSSDFWIILSGSSFYSLALVCSTVYKLLQINTEIKQKSQKNKKVIIVIKEGNKTHRINLDDILFIKGLREYVIWQTKEKKIISLQTLTKIENEHVKNGLLRVHKSYIVNTKKISHKEGSSLKIDTKLIPIGRTYKEQVALFFDK